jgi:hypothetical protein
MPHFASVFDLSLEAISKINPSQLRLPRFRRVGDRSVLPEEAQYEDELYRSIFAVTSGNVCLSPEFATSTHGSQATASRAISLFIPVVKWGIELTRDGSRLTDLERNSRFASPEAYGAWLTSGDMTDYILLDCRTSIPTTKYPSTISSPFPANFCANFFLCSHSKLVSCCVQRRVSRSCCVQ